MFGCALEWKNLVYSWKLVVGLVLDTSSAVASIHIRRGTVRRSLARYMPPILVVSRMRPNEVECLQVQATRGHSAEARSHPCVGVSLITCQLKFRNIPHVVQLVLSLEIYHACKHRIGKSIQIWPSGYLWAWWYVQCRRRSSRKKERIVLHAQ